MNTPWHLGPLAAYDCETTGTNVDTDRIVTAALVGIDRNVTRWMANPGIDIPTQASDIHGITTAFAKKHGQDPKLIVHQITEALTAVFNAGGALVVVNAPFDLSLLDRECTRHHLPTVADLLGRPVGPIIDPLVLDRAADKWRKGRRNLGALAEHYDIDLDKAHTADADATAGLYVALAIAEKYTELQVPAEVVHGWQVTWRARWAEDYETYLRQTKPDAVISRHWPLIPAAEAVTG